MNNPLEITERTRAEEAILRAKEDWERTFDAVPDLIAILDNDHRIVRVNRAMGAKLGMTTKECAGLTCYQAVHGTNEPPLFCPHRQLLNDGLEHTTEVHEERLGGDFMVSVSPLFDPSGKLKGSVHVCRDLSERKRAEETLRQSRERFQEMAELLPETIFEMDTSGHLTFVNRNAYDHFGYSQEDFELGLNGFDLVSPEDRSRALEHAKKVMNGGKSELNEYKAVRKDGSTFPALIRSSAKFHDGKPVGIRGIVIDVTERKKLESQLRQAQKMEAIGTLAGGIAHDFNNILAPIIGYTELIQTGVPEGSPLRSHLDHVLKSGLRARDLVKQILTFSRLTEQERKPMQIAHAVKETLKLLRSSLPTTIEIRNDIAYIPGGGIVLADSTQIHQVLMNLCTNAAHAMRTSGGILTVRLSEVDAIDVSRHPDLSAGPYLRLTVTDTGHGMDAAILERIFDPYFTTKGPGEGTGIGLSVVQGIVKNYGGVIAGL